MKQKYHEHIVIFGTKKMAVIVVKINLLNFEYKLT